MSRCDECGKQENMPYHCRHCGGTFCGDHRLPENHSCPGLENWDDPSGVFDSGFDDSVANEGRADSGVTDRIGFDTGPGSLFGYFRGNMTYVFLGAMWIVFFAQQFMLSFVVGINRFGQPINPEMFELYRSIFVLQAEHPEYVWTWVTSVFSHGGIFHIATNSLIVFFFGRVVEDYVGSRDFALLFLVSGVVAGLGQIGIMLFQGIDSGVLGASGAALALLGTLTVLNPGIKVYVYFILPVPIWVITIVFAVASMAGIFGFNTPFGGNGIADGAHLLGLVGGLLYGQHVRDRIRVPSQLQFGGGGGGPGGPGGPGRGRGPF